MTIPEELKIYLKEKELSEQQILQDFIEYLKDSYTFTFEASIQLSLEEVFNIEDLQKNNEEKVIIKTSSTFNIINNFFTLKEEDFNNLLISTLKDFKLPTEILNIIVTVVNKETKECFQFFNSIDFIGFINNLYIDYSIGSCLEFQKISTVLKALF